MKYAVIGAAVLVVCALVGVLAARWVARRRELRAWRKVLVGVGVSLGLAAATGFAYVSVYYRADATALEALGGSEQVAVEQIDEGWFLDGPGQDSAIVFYPGAKVDSAAYAPLLLRLSEQGIDCFLLEVPAHLAPLGSGMAKSVMDTYDYNSWYIMGHSLGGVVAAGYVASADGAGEAPPVEGAVLLASYPTGPLAAGASLLSVYGSEDGVLDREGYDKGKGFWPADSEEVVIPGGNHAQFGDYGAQSGDGEATISADQQQEQTADAVLRWID